MLSGLEYVKETIELRGQDIQGNDFETNNILMDDILLALGYNKRRNKGVRAVYSEQADWVIEEQGSVRLIFKVLGYKSMSELGDNIEINSSIRYLDEINAEYLVVTDGEQLSIYDSNGLVYKITNIFDDEADKILNYISYEGWNPEEISALRISNISESDIIEALRSNSSIHSNILAELGLDETPDNIKMIQSILSNIADGKINSEGNNISEDESKEIDRLTKQLEIANKSIAELSETNKSLESQLEQAKNLGDIPSNEAAYRDKISELTTKLQEQTIKLNEANAKLAEIEKAKAGAEDERVIMAKQLMEAVEDNPDLNRTYVGVVNSKLFQIGELPRFIGTCLQELYSAVSFKLMPLLFDGDIFKTIQPAVRNDMMINTKSYDIDIEGYTEEELINKLKVLFNQFPNVVFMCKAIGTVREEVKAFEEPYQDIGIAGEIEDAQDINDFELEENTLDFNQLGILDNMQNDTMRNPINQFDDMQEQSDIGSTGDNNSIEGIEDDTLLDFGDEMGEHSNKAVIDDTSDMQNLGNSENDGNIEYYGAEPEVVMTDSVLALALSDVQAILWDEKSPIKNIKAIANKDRMLGINSNSIGNIIGDSLAAIMVLSNNSIETLRRLNSADLLSVNSNIVEIEGNEEVDITRILNTKYGVKSCDTKQAIDVIVGIASVLEIDMTGIYMYFDATYIDSDELRANYFDFTGVDIESKIDSAYIEDTGSTIHCLMVGDALSEIQDIHGVGEIEEKLFKNIIAVRTPFMSIRIENNEDVVKALTEIINRSVDKGAEQIIQKLNDKLSDKTPIINRDSKNVSVEAASLEVGNREYFIDTLPGYKIVQMLICANYEATGTNLIDIRIELNSALYEAAISRPVTMDANEALGLDMLLRIGKIKILNKK